MQHYSSGFKAWNFLENYQLITKENLINHCSIILASKTLNVNKEEVVVDSSSQLFSPLGDLYGDETNASSEVEPDDIKVKLVGKSADEEVKVKSQLKVGAVNMFNKLF